jgi:hypothetical protein
MTIQLESFTPLFGKLRGPTKWVAKRILNPDLVDALNAIPNRDGVVDSTEAFKNLIALAAGKVTNGIGARIALIFTIVIGVIGVITTTVTFFTDTHVIITIVIFATILMGVWIVSYKISKFAARKISNTIFKVIESKMEPAGQKVQQISSCMNSNISAPDGGQPGQCDLKPEVH